MLRGWHLQRRCLPMMARRARIALISFAVLFVGVLSAGCGCHEDCIQPGGVQGPGPDVSGALYCSASQGPLPAFELGDAEDGVPCPSPGRCEERGSVTDWICVTPSVTGDGGDAGGSAYGDACVDESCALSCPSGRVQCDASCVDLSSSNDHCGFCDQACNGALICVDGKCGCPPGLSECAGYCVDLTSNPDACSSCAMTCSEGGACSGDACP
jgi:hypothetical protein